MTTFVLTLILGILCMTLGMKFGSRFSDTMWANSVKYPHMIDIKEDTFRVFDARDPRIAHILNAEFEERMGITINLPKSVN